MFGIFKPSNKKKKLQRRYEKLMSEAHKLSRSNRKAADQKYGQAEAVMKELESIS